MKTILRLFALTFCLFLSAGLALTAQDTMPPGTEIITPGSFVEVIQTGFGSFFISLAALVALVVFVASWINTKIKANGAWKQIISWMVALALAAIGWLLHLGFLDSLPWYQALIYGFASGLAANGIFDVSVIQSFLKLFGFEKAKPAQPASQASARCRATN